MSTKTIDRLGPAAVLLATALACAALPARADEPPAPTVNVDGIKNPEMRAYRSIAAGLDAFDEYHRLAPQAPLRFQMMRADGSPADAIDALSLRLASDDGSTPVPIGADGRFAMARDPAAYEADASFILNKKAGLYSAHPEVRSPGLPADVRRLGDLRLECRVMVAIVKQQMPFLAKAAINTLLLTSDWCGKDKVNFRYSSTNGRKPAAATLRFGERSQELEVSGWGYKVPIGDTGWPDDALITLRYAPDAPAADMQAAAP